MCHPLVPMSSRPASAARRTAARMLGERPYRDLSVEGVMAEAGLSRTVFYRHFDGLPELVLSRLDAVARELSAALSAEPGPGFTRQVLEAAVDAYARHGGLLRAVAEAASHDEAIERAYRGVIEHFTAMMARLVQDGMATGRIRP